jgi:hypothetical protein
MFTSIIEKQIEELEKTLAKLEVTLKESKEKPIKDEDKKETKTK